MNGGQQAATTECTRCGAHTDDCRVVLFWGSERRAERFVCDECADILFRGFLEASDPADRAPSTQRA
jgi:hypothetical protein